MADFDPNPDPREKARADIRDFLTTRRSRVSPQDAGLPVFDSGRRRVAGLRREEVALLAGVSPQYYVRLERGDATGVSESVVDGIAHALKLDDTEHAHLLHLIRAAGSSRPPRRRRLPTAHRVQPTLQRIVDGMHVTPAMVMNGRLDVLTANTLGQALFSAMFEDTSQAPNSARFVFLDPRARTFFREWDKVADDTVAILRAEAGRDPHDRDISDLVGQLATRSEDFRRRWAAHDVRTHVTGVKLLLHPVVGELDLPFESLPLSANSGSTLVVYAPEVGSPAGDALTLLASWAATADSSSGSTRSQ